MAQDFMVALEAEIAELEAELNADVRFVRLQQLRKTLALYIDPDAVAAEMRSLNARVINPGMMQSGNQLPSERGRVTVRTQGRRPAVDKTTALDTVALHLANRSGPVPTRDLLEHLTDLGVEIGGTSPLNNLSAMLSNSNRFESHGRMGWTLASERAEDTDIEMVFHGAIMKYWHENSVASMKSLILKMEDDEELPDAVKEELSTYYREITGREYIPGNPGGFQRAFIETIRRMLDAYDKGPR